MRPATAVRLRLAALAAAAFVYVTSETFPAAVLPQMAAGLAVGEAAVGRLLSVYAVLVAVTAIPVVVLTARVPRRALVAVAVAALALSNLLVAVAPDYGTVLAGRLVGALGHGVFWSVLAPVAASLVRPGRAGRATAAVFLGNSVALVGGIPLTSALGSAVGWRTAAAVLAVVAALCAVVLRAVLPAFPRPGGLPGADAGTGPRGPGAAALAVLGPALRNRSLVGLCATTLVVVVGHFASYTFITLVVRRGVGASGTALSAVLLGFGLAGALAVVAVGRVLDARPRATTLACVGALAASLAGLGLAGTTPAASLVAVLLWGAGFTAVPICLQAGVLRVAGGSADLASSVYVVAFQVGIAAGAAAGGVFVDGGALGALPFASAAAVAAGGAGVLLGRRAFPRRGSG